jgi:hypothetical protein
MGGKREKSYRTVVRDLGSFSLSKYRHSSEGDSKQNARNGYECSTGGDVPISAYFIII